jgi:hypothetical protein
VHGSLSVANVLSYQVEVSATSSLLETVLGFQLLSGLLPFVHLVKFELFLCVLLLVLSGLVRNCC